MTPEREGFYYYWHRVGWKGTWSAEDDRVTGFYVPLLERSRAYDRMAGYFTSSALSLAAAGLSSFVANGGVMRLIVGAQLDPDDVEAIDRGEPLSEAVSAVLLRSDAMGEVNNVVAEHRRNVLGWLVKEGRLEIRVGVPVDPATGRPYPILACDEVLSLKIRHLHRLHRPGRPGGVHRFGQRDLAGLGRQS